MALSERNKRKHIKKAATLLPPPGATPIDYALGGGGAWPPRLLGLAVFAGGIALTVVLSLLLNAIVGPGWLVLIGIFYLLNQPRGVLLTDRGVASMKAGFLTGRPNQLIAVDGLGALGQRLEQRAGATRVQVGPDAVWLKDRDLERMAAAAARPAT